MPRNPDQSPLHGVAVNEEPWRDAGCAQTLTSTDEGEKRVSDQPSAAIASARRYEINREVARGGLGRVLSAYDQQLRRVVAIKELLRGGGELQARFNREVEITARLQHPGIVPVYDSGTWERGDPFYVMKLLSNGRTLKQVIEEASDLVDRLALISNVIAVADAIAYAHSLGIIHRDIKPANVIVGPFGETVVIDWGLAKELSVATADETMLEPYRAAAADATVAGSILGTPQYMAPEQARGEHVDRRADVYALGALLYYVLAQRAPHAGGRTPDVIERVRTQSPSPVTAHVDGIPPDLNAIVAKSMSLSPADRYADAQELVEDLRRFHTGRLVRAHEYSVATLMRRWARRHRGLLLAAATFLLILVTMAAIGVGRIEHARTVAERERAAAIDKRNELLLLQARASLEHDPTRAIAWLKTYPQDGRDVTSVQAIASQAASLGVARHVLPTGMLIGAAFLPDSSAFVVAGFERKAELWDAVAGRRLASIPFDGDATAVSVSPDGKFAAIVGMKGQLVLWDLSSNTTRVLGQARSSLFRVTFSPDGKLLAASGHGRVDLWNVSQGTVRSFSEHRGPVYLVAFTRDGGAFVSAETSGRLLVTSVSDGRTRELNDKAAGELHEIALSDDGELLAGGAANGTILVWTLARGSTARIIGHTGPAVTHIRFVPHSQLLVSSAADRVVSLWAADGTLVRRAPPRRAEIAKLEVAADGSVFATGSRDGELLLWDVATGTIQSLRGHNETITTLTFAPDGTLISGGTDTTARVWLVSARQRMPRATIDTGEPVMHAIFSPDGKLLASESGRLVRVCVAATAECRIFAGHRTSVYGIAFSLDGRQVASAGWDGTARLWDVATGTSRVFETPGALVRKVSFTADGTQLAVASSDGLIRVWRLDGGAPLVLRGQAGDIGAMAVSPKGGRLIFGGDDGTTHLWDFTTGTETLLGKHDKPVVSTAFAPDGLRAASSSRDGSVRVWDLSTHSAMVLEGHHGLVMALGFSADETLLVAASWDGTASVWDLRSGHRDVFRGHDNRVRAIALSPDARLVATCSDDHTVRLWDRKTGAVEVLLSHAAQVRSVAFSPDGHLLVSASDDGTVRLWNVAPIPSVPQRPAELERWMLNETTMVQ